MPYRALSCFKVQKEKFLTSSTKFAQKRDLCKERCKEKNARWKEVAAICPCALRREEFIRIRGVIRLAHRVAGDRHRGWKLNERALSRSAGESEAGGEKGGREKEKSKCIKYLIMGNFSHGNPREWPRQNRGGGDIMSGLPETEGTARERRVTVSPDI